MDPAALSLFLKAQARHLGFASAGITSADPPSHQEVYQGWIASGRHGEMTYLATPLAASRRADPRELLPDCKTIVVLAAPYSPPQSENGQARVSAYALGEDYHRVLLDRMRQLVAALESEAGQPIPHRLYTDTGPILERELAQRAGLGWIGKNTCLIDPQQGSYFLLAEILLSLPLVSDVPFAADYCGTCTRCLEACPTQCILPDRTLDATRCISYLTIETKSEIPVDQRSAVGNWFFGCDVCQEVCPWNLRFAPAAGDPAFAPRPFLDPPDLARFLSLEEVEYQTELSHSPLKRAKRRGLVRNAAVVAGNSGDPAHVARLSALLNDEDSVIRAHAAWALGRIGGSGAQAALESRLAIEEDSEVASEIRAALDCVAP